MKIIQIIPAPAGMAVTYSEYEQNVQRVRVDNSTYSRYPVACLALVEDANGETSVKPMILEDNGVFRFATDYEDLVSVHY